MVVICKHCNKEFASYSSRSNHIKKYHIICVTPYVTNVTKNVTNCNNNIKDNILNCKYCNEQFNTRQTRWRHEKKCKDSENKKPDELNELKKENQEMKKEMQELKDLIQKSMKIHPKTLQKINSQLGNIVNGDVNNYVIQLGFEDFAKVLSEKEKIGLLNKYSNSVVEMVKLVHVSPDEKFKQYKSMYITNLQNNVAYKYDDNSKKFIAVTKSELLDSIIDNRLADIESFHDDYKEKITRVL